MATIRDMYGNLRNNTRYTDEISVEILKDGVVFDSHELIKQEHDHGYYYIYTVTKVSQDYQVKFYLNKPN